MVEFFCDKYSFEFGVFITKFINQKKSLTLWDIYRATATSK